MEQTNKTYEEFLNSSFVNVTSEMLDEKESFVPQWLVYLYFIFVCLGAAVNFVYFLALLRCRRNGTLSILLQLCAADFLFLYVATVEILTLSNRTWIFSAETCPFFNGVEILSNSLGLWFIICLNFHVISLWNLHKNEIEKKDKNPLTSCQDESNECLVTKKENTNRTLNIDYSKRRNDVSVILPIILIWFFCASLSIPNFALSLTLKMNGNHTICAIVDNFYGHILQRSLLIFRVLLPAPLLTFAFVVLIVKLARTSEKDIDNVLKKKLCEIRGLLIFCITLTVFYFITSFQHNLLHFLQLISYEADETSAIIFRLPPLYSNKLNSSRTVYLAMLHYSGSTFRAFLYVYLLPKFTTLVSNKFFGCCKTQK